MSSSEYDDNITYSQRGYGYDSDTGSDFSGHSFRSSDNSGDNKSGAESEPEYDRNREDDSEEMSHWMVREGLFSEKNAWTENVRKFQTLPTFQHERLSKDIKLEDFFDKSMSDSRYKTLFKYHVKAKDALRSLRIAPRPRDKAFIELQRIFDNFREDIGYEFPSLYDSVFDTFNDIDDFLRFHTDLYSSCNTAFRNILRNRIASIFKAPVMTEILTKSSAKSLKLSPRDCMVIRMALARI